MLSSALLLPLLLSNPASAKCKESKRGLAWPTDVNQGVPLTSSLSAYYTWTERPVVNVAVPFLPMLWGCDKAMADGFVKAVDNNFAVDGYTPRLTDDKALLSFSEPALLSQSNCTPARAAAVWKSHLEPLQQRGYRLGSPAVSVDATGHAWLLEWFVQCRECKPDFMTLHWYGTDFYDLEDTLTGYHDAFKMPIWLTEFAAQNFTNEQHNPDPHAVQPSLLQTTSLLNQSMAWLDSIDWVERYFWFGAMYDMQTLNPFNSLFNALDQSNRSGSLNALGNMYVADSSVDAQCSSGMRVAPGLVPGLAMVVGAGLRWVL